MLMPPLVVVLLLLCCGLLRRMAQWWQWCGGGGGRGGGRLSVFRNLNETVRHSVHCYTSGPALLPKRCGETAPAGCGCGVDGVVWHWHSTCH